MYLWILDTGIYGVLLIVAAIPLLIWLGVSEKSRIKRDTAGQVLVLGAAALLIFVAGHALLDAQKYQFNNCWEIRSSEQDDELTEVLECVPGSTPESGVWWDRWSESGSYRDCVHLNTSSSGGTIWRCESGDI